MADALLEIRGLRVEHAGGGPPWARRPPFVAVDDVSLRVQRGQVLGLVGESGAGKSSIARCVCGIQRPTAGTLTFDGRPCDPQRDRDQRRAIQMVFQDPYASLNPARTVGATLIELAQVHRLAQGRRAARAAAAAELARVGLPEDALDRRPSAFSGGQRQRIAIARALIVGPRLLVADEPVSALDVSVQASVLALLRDLQRQLGLTIVLVSHDLAVVHQLCDRVAVLRDGRLVEEGPVREILETPRHAYTRELVASAPDLPAVRVPAAARAAGIA